VTGWVKPATSTTASGLKPGLALMFTPVRIFTLALDNMISLQKKTWDNMIGAASTNGRNANRD